MALTLDRLAISDTQTTSTGAKENDTLIGGGVADFLVGGDGDDVLQRRAWATTASMAAAINCFAAASRKCAVRAIRQYDNL